MSFVSMMPQHVMGSDHLGRCDSFLSRVPSFRGPLPAPVLKLHLGVLLFLQSWLAWWWRCSAARRATWEVPVAKCLATQWKGLTFSSGLGSGMGENGAVGKQHVCPWEASQRLTVPGVGGPTETSLEFGVKKISV